MEPHMIIETTDNRFYLVHETGNPDLAHVWLGTEMRQDRKTGQWVKKANRRGGRPTQLVSKRHCLRIIQEVPA